MQAHCKGLFCLLVCVCVAVVGGTGWAPCRGSLGSAGVAASAGGLIDFLMIGGQAPQPTAGTRGLALAAAAAAAASPLATAAHHYRLLTPSLRPPPPSPVPLPLACWRCVKTD